MLHRCSARIDGVGIARPHRRGVDAAAVVQERPVLGGASVRQGDGLHAPRPTRATEGVNASRSRESGKTKDFDYSARTVPTGPHGTEVPLLKFGTPEVTVQCNAIIRIAGFSLTTPNHKCPFVDPYCGFSACQACRPTGVHHRQSSKLLRAKQSNSSAFASPRRSPGWRTRSSSP